MRKFSVFLHATIQYIKRYVQEAVSNIISSTKEIPNLVILIS